MSWSYDSSAIGKSLNWVRLRIGDTDTNDQQLSDEEINSLIALYDSQAMAAAMAAGAIAAKFALRGGPRETEAMLILAREILIEQGAGYLCAE